jgi:hypothetical protein
MFTIYRIKFPLTPQFKLHDLDPQQDRSKGFRIDQLIEGSV